MQVNGPDSKDIPASQQLKSPDRSESSRAKSSRRHSSMSPEPARHKHSKRHKKEHSHKKSKRSRHEDDASVDTAPVAVAENDAGHRDVDHTDREAEAATAPDSDLEALRQAALQTTKAAVSHSEASDNVQVAAAETPADSA